MPTLKFTFGSRPCKNSATFCKRSRRARFFAAFLNLNELRPRKSERNRSVRKRAEVFTQPRSKAVALVEFLTSHSASRDGRPSWPLRAIGNGIDDWLTGRRDIVRIVLPYCLDCMAILSGWLVVPSWLLRSGPAHGPHGEEPRKSAASRTMLQRSATPAFAGAFPRQARGRLFEAAIGRSEERPSLDGRRRRLGPRGVWHYG